MCLVSHVILFFVAVVREDGFCLFIVRVSVYLIRFHPIFRMFAVHNVRFFFRLFSSLLFFPVDLLFCFFVSKCVHRHHQRIALMMPLVCFV